MRVHATTADARRDAAHDVRRVPRGLGGRVHAAMSGGGGCVSHRSVSRRFGEAAAAAAERHVRGDDGGVHAAAAREAAGSVCYANRRDDRQSAGVDEVASGSADGEERKALILL